MTARLDVSSFRADSCRTNPIRCMTIASNQDIPRKVAASRASSGWPGFFACIERVPILLSAAFGALCRRVDGARP